MHAKKDAFNWFIGFFMHPGFFNENPVVSLFYFQFYIKIAGVDLLKECRVETIFKF